MRRARGSGGRFTKKKDADTSKHMAEEKGTGSGPILSSQSASSCCSEPLPDSAETWNSSLTQEEARESNVHDRNQVNGSGHYQERGGNISSNQASHRPLAIQ